MTPVLRPYQVDVIAKASALFGEGYRRVLIVAPTGCHARGTSILMHDGTARPVEDVRVGDWLMGPDSTPREVLQLCRGRDQMFRIVPTKGDPFIVNGDHVLSLVRTNDGSRHAGSIVDVSVREYLGWNSTMKHVHKLFRVAVDFPVRDDTPVLDPYFLGLFLGDGTTRGTIGISKPDVEVRQEVERVAASMGMHVRADGAGTSSVTWRMTNGRRGLANPLRRALRSLGLEESRSGDKFIPHRYKVGSRRERLDLLAGLFDSDGHIANGGCDYISQSKRLADDLAFVARSVGLAAYVHPCEKRDQHGGGGTYYRAYVSGDLSVVPTRIARKVASARQQTKSVLRTGFTVEPLDDDDFFGFAVTGDRRYVMGDFTVTHNSGKTVVAAEIIRRLRERRNRALFLAAARELIFQTSNKLNDIDVGHGIIMAGVPGRVSDVQVASVQTLVRRLRPPPAELIVIDEADLARASSYEKILKEYPEAHVLGLTATPWRGDGKGLGHLFEASVVAATPRSLMDVGHLVEADGYVFEPLDLEGVKTTAGDYDAEEQGRRATHTADGARLAGDIVREYLARAAGRRAIAFCVNIEHSKMLAEQFVAAGVPAEHIEGESEDREGILRRLREGTTHVVTNCQVLTRGVDIPAVEVVILARATKSVSLYLQMVGRGLRPSPATGKARALILDHAGCVMRRGELVHGLPDAERDYSLTADIQKRAKKGEQVAAPSITQCRTCYFVTAGAPETCPKCGAVLRRAKSQVELVGAEAEAIAFDQVQKTAVANKGHVVFLRDLFWTAHEKSWKPKAAEMRFKTQFGFWPGKAIVDAASRAAWGPAGKPITSGQGVAA